MATNARQRRSSRYEDSFTRYQRDLQRVEPLDARAQQELAERYRRTGDPRIARRLIEANQRLVLKIARRYGGGALPLGDVVQEGNLGLLLALSKYDPSRGIRLSSYAVWWIRAYVLRHLVRNWRLVRLGTSQADRKLFFNLRKTERRLEADGEPADAERVGAALGVTAERVREVHDRMSCPELSLDAPAQGGPERERALIDLISGPEDARPDVACESHELRELVRAQVKRFHARLRGPELHLFRERWLSEQGRSLTEVGRRLGLTREQARRTERRLLLALGRELAGVVGSR